MAQKASFYNYLGSEKTKLHFFFILSNKRINGDHICNTKQTITRLQSQWFPSKEIFEMFQNLDEAFEFIVENEPSEKRAKIEVIGTYPDACEELDGLFPNATNAIANGYNNENEYYYAALKFFKRIKIVE